MFYDERAPTDASHLNEWGKREERAKSILGLSLLDSQLHLIDLQKSSTEIWDELNKVFGVKVINANFS